MHIANKRVESLPGYCVVFSWANLGGKPGGEDSLSESFSQNSDGQNHICSLECIPEDIEISGSEDEKDGREVGNAGSPGVLP